MSEKDRGREDGALKGSAQDGQDGAAAQQRPTELDGRSGREAGRTGEQKNGNEKKGRGKNMNRYGKRKDGARL